MTARDIIDTMVTGAVGKTNNSKSQNCLIDSQEILNGLLLIWWGIALMTTKVFDGHVSYSAMSDMARQGYWSIWFVSLGLVSIFSIVLGLFRVMLPRTRLAILLASVGTWAFVMTMFIIGNSTWIGWGTYLFVTLNALACYLRTLIH